MINIKDWWDECRVNEHTARKSINRMVKRGLLIKATYKFNGNPTTHIRINWDRFEEMVIETQPWGVGPDGNDQEGRRMSCILVTDT